MEPWYRFLKKGYSYLKRPFDRLGPDKLAADRTPNGVPLWVQVGLGIEGGGVGDKLTAARVAVVRGRQGGVAVMAAIRDIGGRLKGVHDELLVGDLWQQRLG